MSYSRRPLVAGLRLSVIGFMLSACTAMRPIEFAELQPQRTVRLETPNGLRIERSGDAPPTVGAPCVASQVDGEVERINGDTLHFARFRAIRTLGDAADCRWTGGAYVVMSASADLRFSRQETSSGRSAALVVFLLLLPVAALGLAGAAVMPPG